MSRTELRDDGKQTQTREAIMKYRVTYEIVTPESAAHGDAESRGFVGSGGWHYDEPEDMTLREALDLVSPIDASSTHAGAGLWFVGQTVTDYRTGDNETRNLHASGRMTENRARRLARLFGIELH